MSEKLDFTELLDFTEMDMTGPNKVVEEILRQLPEATNNIVHGRIEKYTGHVTSYTAATSVTKSLTEALGSIGTEKRIDIQDSLGKLGEKEEKFECYLYTSSYDGFKYRMFFMSYGVAIYPVRFTLEESIARSIQGSNSNYFVFCNNRGEVEELVYKILTSKKILDVMQELIRIHQAQVTAESEKVTDDPNGT